MFRYAAVNDKGEFLEVKGQDLFVTKEDAEKAIGKTKGYTVRPVPVGTPVIVSKPRQAPAEVARKRAKVKTTAEVTEPADSSPTE